MSRLIMLGGRRRPGGWVIPTLAPSGFAVVDSGDSWAVLSCIAVAGADWYEIDYRVTGAWITYTAQFTNPAAMVLADISTPELLEFRVRAHY